MRIMLRRIANILDGQPTGLRGQSLVEMTITFPILILMILSLVEVGLVANNYMVLMDVVRNAARDAVNFSPGATQWVDADTRNQFRLACNTEDPTHFQLLGNAVTPKDDRRIPRAEGLPGYTTSGMSQASTYNFFTEIVCQVTKGLSPLVFNDYAASPPNPSAPANLDAKDDIVVSAVSFANVDYTSVLTNPYGGAHAGQNTGRTFTGAMIAADPGYYDGPAKHNDTWVTVTGRWPLANRYCATAGGSGDSRDPFDWKRADFVSGWHNGLASGADTNEITDEYWMYNSGSPVKTTGILSGSTESQGVRGFIFTGRARNDDGCYGSRFTVQDIEAKLNLDKNWNPTSPNSAAVIVELFWQHHPLVLGRLFEGFTGNRADDPVLYVWAWYPLSSAEPTQTP